MIDLKKCLQIKVLYIVNYNEPFLRMNQAVTINKQAMKMHNFNNSGIESDSETEIRAPRDTISYSGM